jgi:hypothetical protein
LQSVGCKTTIAERGRQQIHLQSSTQTINIKEIKNNNKKPCEKVEGGRLKLKTKSKTELKKKKIANELVLPHLRSSGTQNSPDHYFWEQRLFSQISSTLHVSKYH